MYEYYAVHDWVMGVGSDPNNILRVIRDFGGGTIAADLVGSEGVDSVVGVGLVRLHCLLLPWSSRLVFPHRLPFQFFLCHPE